MYIIRALDGVQKKKKKGEKKSFFPPGLEHDLAGRHRELARVRYNKLIEYSTAVGKKKEEKKNEFNGR